MELEGTVEQGVVVLDEPTSLPDGTRVTVTAAETPSEPSHFELLRNVIGQAVGLPEDMALNHNHYLHGGPKR